MSNHDKPQIDLDLEEPQPPRVAQEAAPDLADDGQPEFRITVRKLPVRVQARGVLAE